MATLFATLAYNDGVRFLCRGLVSILIRMIALFLTWKERRRKTQSELDNNAVILGENDSTFKKRKGKKKKKRKLCVGVGYEEHWHPVK